MKYIVKYHGKNAGKGVHVTELEADVLEDVTAWLKSTIPGRELTISVAGEDDIASQFIGLTTEQAEAKAEELNLSLRNWSKIGVGTRDLRADRINIWTYDEIVVKAEIG